MDTVGTDLTVELLVRTLRRDSDIVLRLHDALLAVVVNFSPPQTPAAVFRKAVQAVGALLRANRDDVVGGLLAARL